MSENTRGLRRFLNSAAVYTWLQDLLIGGAAGRARYVEHYLRIRPGDRILDIGCGTATILDVLPSQVDYIGVDHSAAYIEAARKAYGDRATFICADIATLSQDVPFNVAMANGVLHHLDDLQATNLMVAVSNLLKPDGSFITIDGAYVAGQSKLARWMLDRDRGENVRTPEAYAQLAATAFADVRLDVVHNLMRIPYTHAVMRMGAPKHAPI